MKFRINRTSDWESKNQPCEGAYPEDDIRGGSFREWYIDINTLEDLIDLVGNVGNRIIVNNRKDEELELEIYDDYRE